MDAATFRRQRAACAYFFAAPSLAYGLFTSRLPALKLQIGASDLQIGTLMLGLGCATLSGLLAAGFVIEKAGPRIVMGLSSVLIAAAISAAALAGSFWLMMLFFCAAGVAVGFCDVAINAQGIWLEKKYGLPCLSFLHASSSLGGVAGSLAGSFFAGLGCGPLPNFCVCLGIFLLAWPWAMGNSATFMPDAKARSFSWRMPCVVWICAAASLLCHIAEGSVGEWGSLLLNDDKGATARESALAFGAFTSMMVISRLCGDRLRLKFGDFPLILLGSIAGALGMAIVLWSPWPLLCLAGCGLMGLGLGPAVPVFFSRAGAAPGVPPGMASAAVSVFSYAGMLVIPPLIGIFGEQWGVEHALWLIPAICLLTGASAFLIVRRGGGTE